MTESFTLYIAPPVSCQFIAPNKMAIALIQHKRYDLLKFSSQNHKIKMNVIYRFTISIRFRPLWLFVCVYSLLCVLMSLPSIPLTHIRSARNCILFRSDFLISRTTLSHFRMGHSHQKCLSLSLSFLFKSFW